MIPDARPVRNDFVTDSKTITTLEFLSEVTGHSPEPSGGRKEKKGSDTQQNQQAEAQFPRK